MDEINIDYRQLVRNTLKSEAYWIINKNINRILGLECALLLSDLISKEEYFDKREMLGEDGSFFNSVKNTKRDTGLSEHIQKKALKILKEYDLLDVRRAGVPPKRSYRLNWLKITCLISQNTTDRIDVNQPDINNNKDNNNKINEVILKNNNIDKSTICLTNPLIDYWNSLDNVKKHKNTNTKIYQKSVKALRSLRAGTFYRKNIVDPKFLLKHRLPNPRNKKFTNDEINTAMKNLSLLLTGGYGYSNGNHLSWPDDNLRTRLRALSFVDLLWHPKTNKSFFLLGITVP